MSVCQPRKRGGSGCISHLPFGSHDQGMEQDAKQGEPQDSHSSSFAFGCSRNLRRVTGMQKRVAYGMMAASEGSRTAATSFRSAGLGKHVAMDGHRTFYRARNVPRNTRSGPMTVATDTLEPNGAYVGPASLASTERVVHRIHSAGHTIGKV